MGTDPGISVFVIGTGIYVEANLFFINQLNLYRFTMIISMHFN